MTSIKVTRSSEYANSKRKFKVIVDGKNVESIKDGEALEIPVQPGDHELYLKIDWCGSNTLKFSVKEGEQLQFYVCLRGDWFKLSQSFFYMFFIPYRLLLLEKVDESKEEKKI